MSGDTIQPECDTKTQQGIGLGLHYINTATFEYIIDLFQIAYASQML